MGYTLSGMSLKNLFSKPATRRYPFEPQVYTEMMRGHIDIDMDVCILCSICQKRCPATAIVVDKPGGTWELNPFACVQCGACVRACPKKCLFMRPDYSPVAAKMSNVVVTKPPKEEKPAEEKSEDTESSDA